MVVKGILLSKNTQDSWSKGKDAEKCTKILVNYIKPNQNEVYECYLCYQEIQETLDLIEQRTLSQNKFNITGRNCLFYQWIMSMKIF